MRSLVVMFFFFVLLFGVGTIILSLDTSSASTSGGYEYSLGRLTSAEKSKQNAVSTEVDRYDDSDSGYPCTDAPNDCNLRSAIQIANSDEKPTRITFADSYLITLSSPLPTLTADHTVVEATRGQEVHLNGNGTAGSVLRITGAYTTIKGLRVYGAGSGYPNVAVSENAHHVIVAENVIGDDDAPFNNCGSSDGSYGGVYIDAAGNLEDGYRAWIYSNIIECNRGIPGDGITVRSTEVIIGKDETGNTAEGYRNTIRLNNGFGINLTDSSDNTVNGNMLIENKMGGLYISNFHNNNIMFNEIVRPSNGTN